MRLKAIIRRLIETTGYTVHRLPKSTDRAARVSYGPRNRRKNDLEKFFLANDGRVIHKWMHYFEIYDRHFSRFRGTDAHIVEIGVGAGGSLRMWKKYFGPKCTITGVDVVNESKLFEEEQVQIVIGDQADREFLRELAAALPRIDILIDDGGHEMDQQIVTFEELFPHVAPTGVYLCEDLHTSYLPDFGGGYKKPGTYIEYSKSFIDYLHAWHAGDAQSLTVTEFTKSAYSLHYYDSILVIEKRPMEAPLDLATGSPVGHDNPYLLKLLELSKAHFASRLDRYR